MNIYITPDNETKLRKIHASSGSMSGLINKLLAQYFSEVKL